MRSKLRFFSGTTFAAMLLIIAGQSMAQDAVELSSDEPAGSAFTWFGDLLLRADHVSDLPNNRADLTRYRFRARAGVLWSASDSWTLGAALEGALGSDSNKNNRANNDNERSDDVNLDEFFARWQSGESSSLLLGKTRFPLELSPMVWDDDLRPIGASFEHSWSVGEFDRLGIVAGYFAGDHLYGDDSRIAAAQVGWHLREGAETHGEILLSFLDFDDLEDLARQGLTRANTRVAGLLVNDYRLLDLQLAATTRLGAWPLEARIDLVRNLDADTNDEGGRFSLVWGDRWKAQGWEFGYSYQRIQRDAVLAAFNADDWWFHSRARGYMPWVGYGLAEHWSVRVAAFIETLDGLEETNDRVLVDLQARW